MTLGERVNQPHTFPDFILDTDCPVEVVEEFLAGLYGGDGHAPSLVTLSGKMTSIRFSASATYDQTDALAAYMVQLSVLLARSGIGSSIQETTVSKATQTFETERTYKSVVVIPHEDVERFAERIGFRYCAHKSQRLAVAASYRSLRRHVDKHFPTFHEYIKDIGAELMFHDPTKIQYGLTPFYLKVIHIKEAGLVEVGDIEVQGTTNFVADGVVVHNSHINAGLSHFLAEKFNKDSDGDCMHLCPKCHTLTKYICPEHPDAKLDTVHIPQAFSLLVSELRAMNVAARLTVAPRC